MTSVNKPRARIQYIGEVPYRLVSKGRGWSSAYGQTWSPAKWACTICGSVVTGDHEAPDKWAAESRCVRNGHAPCAHCGKPLARLNDGCPREHNWRSCPGKTEADRMQPQHAHKGHLARAGATA